MKGFLLVIDGIDGAGKTTQIDLLCKYLSQKNIPFEVISFPRYGDNLYGKLVRRYLSGEFGSIGAIEPSLIALAYAGDRLLAKPLVESWVNSGKIVIANRYTSSSKAHLSANLPQEKREEFMRWLEDLEYQTNKLSREDMTILLKVDPRVAQKNVQGENLPDIHEDSINHLDEADKIYQELSKSEKNWKVIDCMQGSIMKSKKEIHKLIVDILDSYLVI